MPVSAAFLDMVKDALNPLNVSVRRMFGGAGLYCDGVMFALVEDDTLYFKADEKTEPRFKAEGMTPFAFEGQTRIVETTYWRAPERLFDDTDDMQDFAREAVAVAIRSKAAKAKRVRRPADKAAKPSGSRKGYRKLTSMPAKTRKPRR